MKRTDWRIELGPALALLLAGIAPGQASDILTAVGVDTNTGAGWRTTTVVKPFAVNDGSGLQNVYGKEGYLALATGSAGAYVPGVPTAEVTTGNATTAAAGMSALNNLPSWVTIAAVGTGWNWWSPFPEVPFDNPTLTPGPSVADIASGSPFKSAPSGSFFTLIFGASAPTNMRIGFLESSNYPDGMTLSNAVSGAYATQMAGSGTMRYVFFDVQNAANQTLTLSLIVPSQNNYGMSAFTFDVIPPRKPVGTVIMIQ